MTSFVLSAVSLLVVTVILDWRKADSGVTENAGDFALTLATQLAASVALVWGVIFGRWMGPPVGVVVCVACFLYLLRRAESTRAPRR